MSSDFSLKAEDYGEIEQKEAKGTKGWWGESCAAFRVDPELRVDWMRKHRREKEKLNRRKQREQRVGG